MSFKKYPWYRFQRWLNQQPDGAIAGYDDPNYNVISKFLEHKVGGFFYISNEMIAYSMSQHIVVSHNIVPIWVRMLIVQISLLSQNSSYQYRTVKKALKLVSKELREQQRGG